jgi:hypothetical protein
MRRALISSFALIINLPVQQQQPPTGHITQNKARTDTMMFDREAITLQITEDFEQDHPYFQDDEEHPLGPHRKTDGTRDIIQDFFQEYDELMNC